MPVFQELSVELVTRILSSLTKDNENNFSSDLTTLCSLSITCHWLHSLVQPLLFKNISLAFDHAERETGNFLEEPVGSESPTGRIGLSRKFTTKKLNFGSMKKAQDPGRCALFLRSLQENQNLALMVQNITISWSNGDQDVHDKANQVLSLLPSLATLTIHTMGDDIPFRPLFLELNTFENLQIVNLRHECLSIEDIQRFTLLDNVERIIVRSQFLGKPLRPVDSTKHSSLLSLKLDPAHHMPPDALHEVLKMCPKIRTLQCALPGSGIAHPTRGTCQYLTAPLSPVAISEAVASSSESLQVVEFQRGWGKWPGSDGSRMDLSLMKALKNITCPAECFFNPGAPYPTRLGLFKLLPQTLENLTLDFERAHGLFSWHSLVDDDVGDSITRQLNWDDLSWLLELATNKTYYTPRLTTIHLQDYAGGDIRSESLSPPRMVAQCLDGANIRVTGSVNMGVRVQHHLQTSNCSLPIYR